MQCYLLRQNFRPFKVRVGEHSSISPLTNKRSKTKKSIVFKGQILVSDQLVSCDDFKVLPSGNSEFYLKAKESLLISRDQAILNKNEHLFHYICLINYTNILQSYMTI